MTESAWLYVHNSYTCSQDLPYWNVDEMHEIILLYSCLSFVFVHWNSSCSHYLKHLFLWNFNTCQKFIDWWILLFIRILALVFFSEHLAIDPFSSTSRVLSFELHNAIFSANSSSSIPLFMSLLFELYRWSPGGPRHIKILQLQFCK